MTAVATHELLVLEEVARELRVSLSAVRGWVRSGRLRAFSPSRRVLVRRVDLDAFIASGDRAKHLRTPEKSSPPDAATSKGEEDTERGHADVR